MCTIQKLKEVLITGHMHAHIEVSVKFFGAHYSVFPYIDTDFMATLLFTCRQSMASSTHKPRFIDIGCKEIMDIMK